MSTETEVEKTQTESTATKDAAAPQASSQSSSFLSQSRVRHEWYQNENFVIISIFIKNVKQETVDVYYADRSIDPLAHEIVPKECKKEVLSTKIEIKLKKEKPGIKWGVLEGDDSLAGSFATSDARNAKNWDKLEKEISKDQEKPEGDAALNSLFQQLYKDADDDTRRAMLKSYTESSGTCLSTNWGEVSKSKVETKPPEGMIAKKANTYLVSF
ncbi:15485_t:CDS:2 [Cetraspora pellucida]|uniref:15485_t:CDS:1 n=1 Tax=Cetraspora pellucida TaxID=1433469 RepID=A0ACA9JZ79_9GLOM|nr:15485_t:CDS:2 [Cetraspora pellucida]